MCRHITRRARDTRDLHRKLSQHPRQLSLLLRLALHPLIQASKLPDHQPRHQTETPRLDDDRKHITATRHHPAIATQPKL